MPRIVKLTTRFLRRAQALGVWSGTPLSHDVGRVVQKLASAVELPLPGDVHALMPPTSEAFVRRVPGRNVWLWYRATDAELKMLNVTDTPPVPVDE